MSNGQVSRAALYDKDDFLCVASSTNRFDLEPDDVCKVSQIPPTRLLAALTGAECFTFRCSMAS